MTRVHQYDTTIEWTGNDGSGTSGYTSYQRSHIIRVENKPVLEASSDKAFRGDDSRHNPEELFVASIAGCHMLWYLHLCAEQGVVVERYTDRASGRMETGGDGSGRFVLITLMPEIIVKEETMITEALLQHRNAHEMCFLANSVNFPVLIQPDIKSRPLYRAKV